MVISKWYLSNSTSMMKVKAVWTKVTITPKKSERSTTAARVITDIKFQVI